MSNRSLRSCRPSRRRHVTSPWMQIRSLGVDDRVDHGSQDFGEPRGHGGSGTRELESRPRFGRSVRRGSWLDTLDRDHWAALWLQVILAGQPSRCAGVGTAIELEQQQLISFVVASSLLEGPSSPTHPANRAGAPALCRTTAAGIRACGSSDRGVVAIKGVAEVLRDCCPARHSRVRQLAPQVRRSMRDQVGRASPQ